uniref:Reverse transcriptase domain-containing protein n=1 Tax=Fagus sylvatica TaxID=28930 RepID=A0A2N9I4C0_FAGSY
METKGCFWAGGGCLDMTVFPSFIMVCGDPWEFMTKLVKEIGSMVKALSARVFIRVFEVCWSFVLIPPNGGSRDHRPVCIYSPHIASRFPFCLWLCSFRFCDSAAHLLVCRASFPSSAVQKSLGNGRQKVGIYREKDEIMWRQRSRVSWLTEGDKNTKFFHESASKRRRTNTIMGIHDQNVVWQTDPLELERVTVDYFTQMFTSSNPHAIDDVVEKIVGVVNPGLNDDLIQPFTHAEVQRVLFQMHPSKAPSPDDSQSAFVPGRMILDNIIIAFETIHYLKNLRNGKNAQMAVKLDMSKAYDRVEWDYLQAIMLKLGFHENWVRLIMVCVRTPTYAVMVNGEPKGYVKPQRGCHNPIFTLGIFLGVDTRNGATRTEPVRPKKGPPRQNNL